MHGLQVRDWGPGQPTDLGNLQVESFAPGDDPADDAKPFADVLARRLEWLQVRALCKQMPLPILTSYHVCCFRVPSGHLYMHTTAPSRIGLPVSRKPLPIPAWALRHAL